MWVVGCGDGNQPSACRRLCPRCSRIGCARPAVSLAFWCDVLGFPIACQRPERDFAYLERDGAQVMLVAKRSANLDRHWRNARTLASNKHGGILHHADGVFQRQGNDPGTKANTLGPGRNLGQKDQRGRQPALLAMEVMLCDPGRVETKPLGCGNLQTGQMVTLSGRSLIQQAGEETELLFCPSLAGSRPRPRVLRRSGCRPDRLPDRGSITDRRPSGRFRQRTS
jgi:hypothetical protein